MKLIEIVNNYHETAIQGLREMIRECALRATENTYPFEATIMAMDRYYECDMPTPITIDNIVVNNEECIVCYNNGEGEDCIELFSYDETYDILCNLCRKL